MKPLVRGQETELIEIPANWYLDDLPPMMFVKTSPNSHGFVNPRHLEEMWRDQFDWVHREDRKSTRLNSSHANISYAVFCLKKKKKTYYVMKLNISVKYTWRSNI